MWLARITPPPKPCTASVLSSESKVLCWITTSAENVRMHQGEEQCRNVESAITTPGAVAATSIATPAPPAPPSSRRARKVIALEVATLMNARVARGRHARGC